MTIEQILERLEVKQDITIDDGLQVNSENIAEKLKQNLYDYEEAHEEIDFILHCHQDGRAFDMAGLGMLGVITGKEKTRKSTFLSALTAAGLSGQKYLNFTLKLPPEKNRIVFFDTEQSKIFWKLTQRRVHKMARLFGNDYSRYQSYMMRNFSIEERIEAIDFYIKENKDIGLLVIDGVLDMLNNFNDERECHAFTLQLLRWSVDSGALIMTVIHQTKGMGYMLGHIGSMLLKKCDFAIELVHDKKTGFTSVINMAGRTERFEEFEFTQNRDGFPILNHNEKPSWTDDINIMRQLPPERDDYPAEWD